jgi:hypothetical protein
MKEFNYDFSLSLINLVKDFNGILIKIYDD